MHKIKYRNKTSPEFHFSILTDEVLSLTGTSVLPFKGVTRWTQESHLIKEPHLITVSKQPPILISKEARTDGVPWDLRSLEGKKNVHLEAIRQGTVNSDFKVTIGKLSLLVKQTFLRKQYLLFLSFLCLSTCPGPGQLPQAAALMFWDRLCLLFHTGAVSQPLLTPTPTHVTLREHLVLEIIQVQRDLWSLPHKHWI